MELGIAVSIAAEVKRVGTIAVYTQSAVGLCDDCCLPFLPSEGKSMFCAGCCKNICGRRNVCRSTDQRFACAGCNKTFCRRNGGTQACSSYVCKVCEKAFCAECVRIERGVGILCDDH